MGQVGQESSPQVKQMGPKYATNCFDWILLESALASISPALFRDDKFERKRTSRPLSLRRAL